MAVSSAHRVGGDSAAAIEQLRLLNTTLAHAARHSPYYARRLRGEAVELREIADLRRFPILTRELVVEHEMELMVPGVFPEYVACTGGTTLGSTQRAPLRRFQSEAERNVWTSLHAATRADHEGDWPLEIRLTTNEHGLDFPGALTGVFPMALERPSHFLALVSLLRTEFSIPGFSRRVRSLSGSLTGIKPLTLLCMERGIDGADFGLDLVCVHGWHVTPRWRKLLEEFWRAPLSESYGLSEVPGLHAVRCAGCGHFHFSQLSVTEVLDLDSDEPVERGVGRIVATSLYPLNQVQPLLRYDTEDVIEIVADPCRETDRFGFEYLGRRHDLVRRASGARGELLCYPIMLSELLGDLPDIALQPHFRVAALGLSTTFGWQKYEMVSEERGDTQTLRLRVELIWSPRSFPDAAAALSTRIERALVERSPALGRAIAAGDVELRIALCEPGSTDVARLV
jgi:phenylacetate-coenzyme A ligase PaaK-like adenylate-forming protein